MGNYQSRRLFVEPGLQDLQGPDKDGNMWRPASAGAKKVWFHFDVATHSWKWAFHRKENEWHSVYKEAEFNYKLAQGSHAVIKVLRELNPRPMVQYVRESKSFMGEGSFGKIFSFRLKNQSINIARSYYLVHKDRCAVKIFKVSTADSSKEEEINKELAVLGATAQLPCENIVFYWGTTCRRKNRKYLEYSIVMEYCDDNLRKLLRGLPRNKAMDPPLLHTLITDVLFALHALHTLEIVHGDLKPENILYTLNHGVYVFKVCDFGFARDTSVLSSLGMTRYTPTYAPPEYYTSHRTVGLKSDIFALGVTLYEACSGNLKPFRDAPDFQANDLQYTPLLGDSTASVAARALIDVCLRRFREDRPTADEAMSIYKKASI